ncbi:TlpA family protein disulfide reductase [Luedemannella helvata]|uniref:Thioredoxin domain-containing protein n=1 Tax=Luedemannella helvata TaxID=349315 RepID=A0ABP4VW98_9ACTN
MLVAVVVLCIALTALNLILTLGVVRRLRDHASQITDLAAGGERDPMIAVGTRPHPFTATTVDGQPVTEANLAKGGLVAFFSPTCSACEEWIPRFRVAAAELPGGRGQALAVVVAETPDGAADLVERLRDVATVVVEGDKGPLATRFRIAGYPAAARLDRDGVVVANWPSQAIPPVPAAV